MNKLWDCRAIDHAVTFLPNGKISPCCIIQKYEKDITELNNPDRFSDLKVTGVPAECKDCTTYKSSFNQYTSGIEMIDFRNNNLCNLKCRTCGPHASSSWAKELGREVIFEKTNVDYYINQVLTGSVKSIYFAGGEPLLNSDHWNLLDKLIELNISKDILLTYSTNLTTLGYKDKNVFDYWRHFKYVNVLASIDATGTAFEQIRSGASWHNADRNLNQLISIPKVGIVLAFTLSVLSVWFLPDVIRYATSKNIKVSITLLNNPHFYALNVLPDLLVTRCVEVLTESIILAPYLYTEINQAIDSAKNNNDTGSFMHMIATVLLTDKIRNEDLFSLLPFKDIAVHTILDINDN